MSREPTKPRVRCAIYTRKSSEEGLDQQFNSLDAQREAAEAYIASQTAEGWTCLAHRYDDGGFTGGNMERPAIKRLMADIEAGKIDCVVVYKVDRLSRSLLDFARMMETFERHGISFVSVTQHFNTTHSMGRLTLNILLSFAQFEREIIGERIRDKIAAMRQKGRWTGGVPPLGYDVDRTGGSPRLVVNGEEAARVRAIFRLYLECGSLLATAQELERRGWRGKTRTGRNGQARGGEPLDRVRLHHLLRNLLYTGRLLYKGTIYPGEHPAIVDAELFEQVQKRLQQNRNGTSSEVRNKYGALLRKLLHCKACGRVMCHTFTTSANKRYRYYQCATAGRHGRSRCATRSLPAAEIERAVVEQIAEVVRDRGLMREVLAGLRREKEAAIDRLNEERSALEANLARLRRDAVTPGRGSSAGNSDADEPTAARQEQLLRAEGRLEEVTRELAALERQRIDPRRAATVYSDFDGVWAALSPREQARLVRLLVERVTYDPNESAIEIAFHDAGFGAEGRPGVEDAA